MNLPVPRRSSRPSPREERPRSLLAAFFRWATAHVRVDEDALSRLRERSSQGTVVYVMRYRSVVDFLAARAVLERLGLPVPRAANDVPAFLVEPLRAAWAQVRALWRKTRTTQSGRKADPAEELCRSVSAGQSVLVFTRARPAGIEAFGGAKALAAAARSGSPYLQRIVEEVWRERTPVFVVPLALLRGKGFRRRESRIVTLLYTVQEAPGEFRRLLSLLWNRHDTQLSVGSEIFLPDFLELHRGEEDERIVARLVRTVNVFLHGEERTVWGPPLRPKREVRRRVLASDEVREAVRCVATQRGEPEARVWRTAGRMFHEMAANFHPVYFSILEFAFNRIWPRIFQGLEYTGLERVVGAIKRGPVVLVPCHRSHFDYLFLSYIFHNNYLSPPHIAAGINLAFWPIGPLFRGAGAFFIRRKFDDDPLYKAVFRAYLSYLLHEGYTLEFFIEGGRSRTGKLLPARLGMLSAIVQSYARGVRKDVFLVPVSLHYGRIVEEESYSRELEGAEKERESFWGLVRARRVLRQKYGTAYVTFGEPISLEAELGDRKERLRRTKEDREAEREHRAFVQKLAFRLLREIDRIAIVGATSVSATVLLSAERPALRREDFLARAFALVDFLRSRGVRFTAALERNLRNDFAESVDFLQGAGLLRSFSDADGTVLYVPEAKRLALDYYKNNTIHFFLVLALYHESLLRRDATVEENVRWWLDLYRWEFPLPDREELARELGEVREYTRAAGAAAEPGSLREDHPLVRVTAHLLGNFREAYWIAARTLRELEAPTGRRHLLEAMRSRYRTALLLREAVRPEGNTVATLGNAIERFREMGFLEVVGEKKREPVYGRGPAWEDLPAFVAHLEGRRSR
ncbi:MAG: hypothetical protein KatS3mg076_0322 [Candidatus Binatia bacterium]|nr:MAG: hypothetical protein KatS3mg076_0322 [Candidatus Binatia bacterium]